MLATGHDFHFAKDKTPGTRQNTSDGHCHLEDGMYRSRGEPVRAFPALAPSGDQPCMTQNGGKAEKKKQHSYKLAPMQQSGGEGAGSHRSTSPDPSIPFSNLSNKFKKNFMSGLWVSASRQSTVVGH